MCDPVSMIVGAVGGAVASKALAPKAPRAAAPAADPEVERMKAEADAAAAANRKLAVDKLRRREQQSLVSRGAPTLGDDQTRGDNIINTGSAVVNRRFAQAARYGAGAASSLMSRGSPGAGAGGGGGGSSTRTATAAF